jgi:hypothetical protein
MRVLRSVPIPTTSSSDEGGTQLRHRLSGDAVTLLVVTTGE